MNDLPAGPARFWSAVLLAGAIALALGRGAPDNFRPEPPARMAADTPLPLLEEPQGALPHPPRTFRWTPGGPDVSLAQVMLFRKTLEPFWQSGPVEGPPLEVDPDEVFAGIPAGENLFWRVREVIDGRPRAVSALAEFTFETDTQGRPIGESVAGPRPLPLE